MIGRTVGNFQIVEKLGEGGMGSVYRGIDQMVGRDVAIKVLKPELAENPTAYQRFRTEAMALAKLNHPAIATLYSFFQEGAEYFMVMEYVPGKNLEELIQTTGRIEWRGASAILAQALDGIGHAHAHGILHRDLKPANIMLSPQGNVKVTDFGIARIFSTPRLTRESRVVGTMQYVAPECVLGREADTRSDIYSAGMVFYEMLTGRLPFSEARYYELVRAQVEQVPMALSELGVAVPGGIEEVLRVALDKDPDRRFPDAAAFAAQLQLFVSAADIPAAMLGKETRPFAIPKETVVVQLPEEAAPAPLSRTARNAAIAAGAVVLALLLLVSGFFLVQWQAARKLAARNNAEVSFPAAPPSQPSNPPEAVAPPAEATPGPGDTVVPTPAPEPPKPTPSVKPKASGGNSQPPAPANVPPPSVAPTPIVPSPGASPAPAVIPNPPPLPTPPPARAVRTLANVKSIFVKPLPDSLDTFLRQELRQELNGKVSLAANAESSDSVLTVTIEDERGSKVTRFVGLKGSKRVIAKLSDQTGKREIWAASIDDRHTIVTAHRDNMQRIASRIAKRLRESVDAEQPR